jgi:acetoin utilization protein AcuB
MPNYFNDNKNFYTMEEVENMLVKNILLPKSKLDTISADDTLANALKLIEEKDYLSLPVMEGSELLGVLSSKYVYEMFFKSEEINREKYLQRPVKELMKIKLPMVLDTMPVEEAAAFLVKHPLRFLPVENENHRFIGIVTYKAILKNFSQIFGLKDTRLVIESYDLKGRLAKLTETIFKAGANISSIVQVDPEVMDLKELVIRVKTDEPKKIVHKLNEAGFKVREISQ